MFIISVENGGGLTSHSILAWSETAPSKKAVKRKIKKHYPSQKIWVLPYTRFYDRSELKTIKKTVEKFENL